LTFDMYEMLGISLLLATLLTINAVASLASAGLWRLLERPAQRCSARSRADFLFALRVGPLTLALISVALFLVPSYLSYEPHSTSEVVSKKLAALAIVSAAGVAFALWRGVRSWWATHALLQKWLATADRIKLSQVNVPTFRVRHLFPLIAVVGTIHPRLFIAERVLRTLSKEELIAAIEHECGHLAGRDNLKRSLLRACRDVLMIIPCGRSLDRAWAQASESAADEYAARESATVALNLASALLRIARMIPEGARAAMPVAAFLVGSEETSGVKARVRRLIEIASTDYPSARNRSIARLIPWMSLGLFVLIGVTLESTPHLLATVHSLIEQIVSLLS
jgi:Zn-dependent protease with chaperone function